VNHFSKEVYKLPLRLHTRAAKANTLSPFLPLPTPRESICNIKEHLKRQIAYYPSNRHCYLIMMSEPRLTDGCSPLTFCSCLFWGPAVGVRGSPPGPKAVPLAFPADVLLLPVADAGPPLIPAGDLLPGLPVVLRVAQKEKIQHENP
jgi:hypothetical protein